MSLHALILTLIGLAASARTQWHGIPVLWLIAAVIVLAATAAVIVLARLLIRDTARWSAGSLP